jgi:hypothetical protein
VLGNPIPFQPKNIKNKIPIFALVSSTMMLLFGKIV